MSAERLEEFQRNFHRRFHALSFCLWKTHFWKNHKGAKLTPQLFQGLSTKQTFYSVFEKVDAIFELYK